MLPTSPNSEATTPSAASSSQSSQQPPPPSLPPSEVRRGRIIGGGSICRGACMTCFVVTRRWITDHLTKECPHLKTSVSIAEVDPGVGKAKTANKTNPLLLGKAMNARSLLSFNQILCCYGCLSPVGNSIHALPKSRDYKNECKALHSGGHYLLLPVLTFTVHRDALRPHLPEAARGIRNLTEFMKWCNKPLPDAPGWINLHLAFDAACVVLGVLPPY